MNQPAFSRTGILVFMLLSLILSGCKPAPEEAPLPREGRISTSDGLQLQYRVDGQGHQTVLVIHGGPGFSMAYLRPELDPLIESHTLIYYDQRGGGESSVTADASLISLAKHIEDLEVVRKHFAIDRLVILGHSWGAALAALYAADYPEHVERLVLVDPSPPRASPYMGQFAARLESWMDDATRKRVEQLDAAMSDPADPAAACRAFWGVFIRGYVHDPQQLPVFKGDLCDAPPQALLNSGLAYQLTIEPLGEWDWRARLSSITSPTLIVHGDHDPIPLESAREWADVLPNATLAVIEGSGHFPFVEQPQRFFDVVRRFLEQP